jgi:hypothetical protein
MASAWGGSGIEHAVTLLLDVSREGSSNAVMVEIVKSRGLGGEGEKVTLVLDRDRQRVTAPANVGADTVEARIWEDIRRFMTEPRSMNAIEQAVEGKAATVRRVAKARLTKRADGLYELP